MTDPLAEWWVHVVGVRRLAAIGGTGGDVYVPAAPADPVTVTGLYRDGSKLVTDGNGKQILSSGQFAFPITIDPIPVGSLVTVPARFGGRTSKVITANIGDGGGQPTPDHHEIALL
ncbi:hypothetical protein [Jatrophihabitans sp.]|uniref:hypothetical protein n=1 Tax=Jatrophihabitans sp. TaxID=1932789 RepID=UPI0030C743C6|nr:hypothetical protein [Jatrophihabitans sp.]